MLDSGEQTIAPRRLEAWATPGDEGHFGHGIEDLRRIGFEAVSGKDIFRGTSRANSGE